MTRMFHLAVLVASVLPAAASAQARPLQPPAGDGCRLLQPHGEGLLAAGGNYLARFGLDGVEFIPALGERAAHDLPLRLSLRDIRRGGTLLLTGSDPTVPMPVAEFTVEYDRGGGIRERFEVGAGGLEWSLLFGRPLPGSGDLVVRARVATELRPATGDGDGVSFLLDGVAGVRIGAVLGIDADGRTAAGRIGWDGDELVLTLPGDFVAAASYPLVLDPPIGTATNLTVPLYDNRSPDVAWDRDLDRYLVVWEVASSASRSDIFARLVDRNGASLNGMVVDSWNGLSRAPRVADVDSADRFLVVWQRSTSPFGPWQLHARSVATTVSGMSPTVAVSPAGGNHQGAAVASANGAADHVLVTWTEVGTGIRACRVRVTGSSAPVVLPSVLVAADPLAGGAVVGRSPPSGSRNIIAWIAPATSPLLDRHRVRAIACDAQLNLLGDAIEAVGWSSGPAAPTLERLAIDGDGTDFVLAWEQANHPLLGSVEHDVRGVALRWNGSGVAVASPVQPLANGPGDDVGPAVGWVGPKFVVAWASSPNRDLDYDIRAAEVNAACAPCGATFALQGVYGAAGPQLSPAIATRRAGGADESEALLVYVDHGLWNIGLPGHIITQPWTPFSATGTVTVVGAPCGVGGVGMIGTAGGSPMVGNPDFRFTIRFVPPTVLTLASIGFPGNELVCGSCVLTNPLAVVFRVAVGGAADYPLPMPCDQSFVGLPISFQWLLFNTTLSPCPLAATLSATDRLHVVVGY